MRWKDSDYDALSMSAPIYHDAHEDLAYQDPAFHEDLVPGDPAGRREVNPAGAAGFQLWFASPQALCHFDPAMLSAADRHRFDAIRNPQRREEFSVSRTLLAHVAVPAASAWSLSHSNGHAALAAGRAGWAAGWTIGVDLEQHRPRDVGSIAQFAFSERESSMLLALASPQRERLFYLLWVMKEALAKALQLPLLEALRSCAFNLQGGSWSAAIPTQRCWSVTAFEPRPKMSLAVACVGNEGEALSCPEIEIWEWPTAPPVRSRPAQWPCVTAVDSANRCFRAT